MYLLRALALVVLLGSTTTRAAEWQVVSHEPGFTLYTRSVAGQDLKEFRGVIRIKASMRTVLPMLVDADHMPQWFFNMSEARLLEIGSKDGSFLYFVIKGMWPVSDRDAVVRLQLHQNTGTLALNIAASAEPEHTPLMRNRVRIPRLRAVWTVTPLSATETEVKLEGHADPGGSIPLWMANLVVEHLPESSLRQLRERIEKAPADAEALHADPRISRLLSGIRYPESAP
ncbi:MAG: START domain-containing protein [Moraxellaceae bacterium]